MRYVSLSHYDLTDEFKFNKILKPKHKGEKKCYEH